MLCPISRTACLIQTMYSSLGTQAWWIPVHGFT
ncbi:hypothetical protein LINPERPRIM_LOCUS23238 [Linum perenne]